MEHSGTLHSPFTAKSSGRYNVVGVLRLCGSPRVSLSRELRPALCACVCVCVFGCMSDYVRNAALVEGEYGVAARVAGVFRAVLGVVADRRVGLHQAQRRLQKRVRKATARSILDSGQTLHCVCACVCVVTSSEPVTEPALQIAVSASCIELRGNAARAVSKSLSWFWRCCMEV